ncbi:MAG: transcription elongation factor GreA [Deltaproteobacteria bacterium]
MNDIFLSQKGYEALSHELDELKGPRRRAIAAQLAKARAMGDLSENAEYDAAKEAQAQLERRIVELEGKLAHARIIENEDIPSDKVYVGATVHLCDLDTDEPCVYTVVSPPEANYDENRISIESPIGKALLGHGEGDVLDIDVPAGTLRYKILKITRG